jgi:hypothetical protein
MPQASFTAVIVRSVVSDALNFERVFVGVNIPCKPGSRSTPTWAVVPRKAGSLSIGFRSATLAFEFS